MSAATPMSSDTNEFDQPVGAPVKDWCERPRPPRTALVGKSCSVEPLDLARHRSGLTRAFVDESDPRQWTYLGYGPFSAAQFATWLESVAAGEDPLFHAIVEGETNEPVGLVAYLAIQPTAGSIEVGHVHFSPRLQRTRAATEALFLLARRVFDELGYRRYEWKCNAANAASRRSAERLGFHFEGVFRQHLVVKGRNRDTAWYSMLDSEWPGVKRAHEAWLAPENFDAQGRQKRSLSGFLG